MTYFHIGFNNQASGTASGSRKIKMNYANYGTSIVGAYGVKLVGWPAGVKFTNPSEIGTVAEIRQLRDALKSGSCHWKKLSVPEREQHTETINDMRSRGEVVGKSRKKRSDAGTKRKNGADKENNDRPKKKAKPARKGAGAGAGAGAGTGAGVGVNGQVYKSAATVPSDTENSANE
jgi:hypothetical protein